MIDHEVIYSHHHYRINLHQQVNFDIIELLGNWKKHKNESSTQIQAIQTPLYKFMNHQKKRKNTEKEGKIIE